MKTVSSPLAGSLGQGDGATRQCGRYLTSSGVIVHEGVDETGQTGKECGLDADLRVTTNAIFGRDDVAVKINTDLQRYCVFTLMVTLSCVVRLVKVTA